MPFNAEPLDSTLIPLSSGYGKEGNAFYALVMEPGAYQDSFSNPSSTVVMSFLRPKIWQSAHAVTGSGGKTLTCAFANNNIAGNSIVVRVGMGEIEGANVTLTITDTLGNTYMQAGSPAQQSTTLEAAIFYSVGSNGNGILAGANTITVTIAGSSSVNTAIAVQIDEVFGLITWAGALDQTNTGSNAGSTSVSTGAVVAAVPNELAFVAIASGGGTITPGANWNNDTGGTLSPVGGNLVSFMAQSRLHTQIASLTPSATLSGSNAWAACIAMFKTVIAPVEGSFNMMQIAGVVPKLDNTNELGVSLYIKTSTAGDTALTVGQVAMANSIPVTNASDQTPLTTATATKTSVAGAASDTSLLASNTGRKGATFYNDSTAILYLSYGSGAASTSSYTVQIPANGFFELPPAPVYTGAIRGIWSAANGNVRITEMS